jgi:hypothetical protein
LSAHSVRHNLSKRTITAKKITSDVLAMDR